MSSDSGGDSEETDEDGSVMENARNPAAKDIEEVNSEEMSKDEDSETEKNDGGEESASELSASEELSKNSSPPEAGEDSEIEDPVEDPLLQAGLAEAGTSDYYSSPVYEASPYAQAPKLEVIAEHEILELETPAATPAVVQQQSPNGNEFVDSALGSSAPVFNLDFDTNVLLTGGDLGTDRSSSPVAGRWETLEYLDPEFQFLRGRPPHVSDSALPKNFSEPRGLSSVLRQVQGFVGRRFFGSTAVTPSDSLQSLEFGTAINRDLPASAGSSRLLRHGQSSRNSVSSEGGRRSVRRKRSSDDHKMAGPTGQVVSRSKRFLTKGTAGFLHAKGTSAISLRPTDMIHEGLPSPCGECPHCRKFLKLGDPGISLRALGQTCPCRICTILEDNAPGAPTRLGKQGVTRGKTPGGLGGRKNTGDYGVFCEACSQSGTIDGRCSRYSVSGLGSMPPGPPVQPNVVVGGTRSVVSGSSETPSMESLVARQTSRELPYHQTSRQLSMSSLYTSGPMCRICHSTEVKEEGLISPCRCLGTLKYVHMSCLVHWLEISCRKLRKPAQCELCGYRYQRHKVLNLRNCNWPKCSRKDKLLHSVFVLSVLTMIICAAVTIVCFKADQGVKAVDATRPVQLTPKEVVTLVCGVMFFCGFFVAMYVQVKAHATLYKLIVRFWMINHEWFIEEYRPSADPEWIKKNRIIREQLAAAAAAAAAGRADEERQRFLSVRVDESEMNELSGSISRRSSLSSALNLMMDRRVSEAEVSPNQEGEAIISGEGDKGELGNEGKNDS